MVKKRLLPLLILILWVVPLQALTVKVTNDRYWSIYSRGEQVTYTITADENISADLAITYDRLLKAVWTNYNVSILAGTPYSFSFTPTNDSCFPLLNVHFTSNAKRTIRQRGVAVDPYNYQPAQVLPDDFHAWWDNLIANVRSIPYNAVVTGPSTGVNFATVDRYDFVIDQLDGRKVYGTYCVPKTIGTNHVPLIMALPAFGQAGVQSYDAEWYASMGAIGLGITIHNGNPDANLYQPDDPKDRNKNYMRWAIIAAVRALDYTLSMRSNNWDRTAVSHGGSQGGFLSFAISALAKERIQATYAIIPAWGDHAGFYYGKSSGFVNYLQSDFVQHGSANQETLLRETRYFDTVNFARVINRNNKLFMGVGYIDDLCPPATVFGAFNVASYPKILVQGMDYSHSFGYPQVYPDKSQFFKSSVQLTGVVNSGLEIAAGADLDIGFGQAATIKGAVTFNKTTNTLSPSRWEKLDGPGSVTFGNASARSTTATFGASGKYTLRFVSDIEMGERYTAMDTLTITVWEPIGAPRVKITSGPDRSTTNRTPINLTLSVNEASGYWSTNGTTFTPFYPTANITIDHSCTLHFYGRDAAGTNSKTTNRISYTIDTAAPILTVIQGPAGNLSTNNPFNVKLQTSDLFGYYRIGPSGYVHIFSSNSPLIQITTNCSLYFWGKDRFGNISSTNKRDFTFYGQTYPTGVTAAPLATGINRISWSNNGFWKYKVYAFTNQSLDAGNRNKAFVIASNLPSSTPFFDHVLADYPQTSITSKEAWYYAVTCASNKPGTLTGGFLDITNWTPGGYQASSIMWLNWGNTVNATQGGNNILEFQLKDFTGNTDWSKKKINVTGGTAVALGSYTNGWGGNATTWKRVRIPVADFSPTANFAALEAISIQDTGNTGNFSYGWDEIRFVGSVTPLLYYGDGRTLGTINSDGGVSMVNTGSDGFNGAEAFETKIMPGINATVTATSNRSYTGPLPYPVVTPNRLSFITNKTFTLILSCTSNFGYFSTNGKSGPYKQFSKNGTNLPLSRTTTLFYYGKNISGTSSPTNSQTYSFDTNPPSVIMPISFTTNSAFFLNLSVNSNNGYWSTNSVTGPYYPFAAGSIQIPISHTMSVWAYGRDSLGNTSATNSRTYTVSIPVYPSSISALYQMPGVNRITWNNDGVWSYKIYCSTNGPITESNKASAILLTNGLPLSTLSFDHILSNHAATRSTNLRPYHYAVTCFTGAGGGASGSWLDFTNENSTWQNVQIAYDGGSSLQSVTNGGNNVLEIWFKGLTPANMNSYSITFTWDWQPCLKNYPITLFGNPTDTWTKILIPLSSITNIQSWQWQKLKHISIAASGSSPGSRFGVDEIRFVGGTTPFVWYSDSHTNNLITGNPGAFYLSAKQQSGGVTVSAGGQEKTVVPGANATTIAVMNRVPPASADTIPPVFGGLVSPTSNSYQTTPAVPLKWKMATDAVAFGRYVVEISSSPGFGVLEKSTNILLQTSTNISLTCLPGTKYWRVRALDSSFNQTTSQVWSFIVDGTPPSAPVLANPAQDLSTNSGTILFKWNRSTDSGTGVGSYEIQVSSNNFVSSRMQTIATTNWPAAPVLGNAAWKWRVRASDLAGNVGSFSGTNRLVVDSLPPPTVLRISPTNNSILTNGTVVLTWRKTTDNGASGIQTYAYAVDGLTNLTANTTASVVLPAGAHTWNVQARDAAKNNGAWNTAGTFTVDIPDHTPPTKPVLVSPFNASITTNKRPLFTWNRSTDAGKGISQYLFFINGTSHVISNTNTTSFLPSTDLATNTIYLWRVVALDKAGNTNGSLPWTVKVSNIPSDLLAPNTVTLVSPLTGKTNSSHLVQFIWNRTTDNGPSGINAYIQVLNGISNVTASTSLSVVLADGSYSWSVLARDNVGNLGPASATWTLTVLSNTGPLPDVTAPSQPILLSPANNSATTNRRPLFSWLPGNDTGGSGIGFQKIRVGSITNTLSTNAASYVPSSDLAPGTYQWHVTAVDKAGNTNASLSWTIRISNATGPALPENPVLNLENNRFYADPNPLRPDSISDVMVFHYLSDSPHSEIRIRIHTIMGHLVRTLEDKDGDGKCEWDGKAEGGTPVASGVYLAVMTVKGKPVETRPYRIGVLR